MTNGDLQSQTISFLRFPLIIGVVLIHSRFSEVVVNGVDLMKNEIFPIYSTISYLFSNVFSAIAVPLFYFISGFLFFHKTVSFTGRIYWLKLKKRARTILIPYIVWNLLIIALFFMTQTFLPELISGKNLSISDYTISDWAWAFWNTNMINGSATGTEGGSYPICFQFWFLRDLMVVMLFSPLIYFLLKKLRQCVILCLGILWFWGWWFDITGFSITAIFFFSAGAYFSIQKKNFVECMKPLLPVAIILYVLVVIADLCFLNRQLAGFLYSIEVLIGIIVSVTLVAHFIEKGKWRVNSFLADSSFFIYAYHGMTLTFVMKFMFKLLEPYSEGMMLTLYVLCPTITILIGLFIYKYMKKYLPKTTAFITGGR